MRLKRRKLLASTIVAIAVIIVWGGIGYSNGNTENRTDLSQDIVEEVSTESYLSKKVYFLHSSFESAVLFLNDFGSRKESIASEDLTGSTGGPNEENSNPEFQTVAESALVASTPVLTIVPSGSLLSKEALTFTYEVQDGDTLGTIAQDFGVSLQTILWANNMSSRSILRPGDEIIILPVSGVTHAVARGDTISSIAQKYKIRSDEILSFNNLGDNDIIKIGDVLIIPGGAPVGSSVRSVASAPAQSLIDVTGYFNSPAKGRLTQGLHQYNAVDIGGRDFCNTPVYAAAAGTVTTSISSGWNGGYGNYIKISHLNGTVTLYAHNDQNLVSRGENVSKGQVIALMGATGRTTGCHVHFEVRGARNPFSGQ